MMEYMSPQEWYEDEVRTGRMKPQNAEARINQANVRRWSGGPVKQQNKMLKNEALLGELTEDPRIDTHMARNYLANKQQHPIGNSFVGEFSNDVNAEAIAPRGVGGNIINRLAGPMRGLPSALGDVPSPVTIRDAYVESHNPDVGYLEALKNNLLRLGGQEISGDPMRRFLSRGGI